MRQISFSVEPGVRYRMGGPTISVRASVFGYFRYENKLEKERKMIGLEWATLGGHGLKLGEFLFKI